MSRLTSPRPSTLVATTLLLATACSSSGGGHARSAQAAAPGAFDASRSSTVQVTATDFRFDPSSIVGRPGERLTLVVRNTSQTPHTFTAKGAGIDVMLPPGATRTVTLTVPSTGQLAFVCTFHAASGMTGDVAPEGSTAGAPTPAATQPTGGGGGGYGYQP